MFDVKVVLGEPPKEDFPGLYRTEEGALYVRFENLYGPQDVDSFWLTGDCAGSCFVSTFRKQEADVKVTGTVTLTFN